MMHVVVLVCSAAAAVLAGCGRTWEESSIELVTFQTLACRWQGFSSYEVPCYGNCLTTVAANDSKRAARIENFATTTRPFFLNKTRELAKGFLALKRRDGSSIERSVYSNMSIDAFLTKLFTHRPLAFLTPKDEYLLQDGQKGVGKDDFLRIGTEDEAEPFVLSRYNSYDEMQISALMGIGVPSYFINDGSRDNNAVPGKPGTFEEEGVVVEQIGCCFERANLMEWRHMLVTEFQNREENGYGARGVHGTKRDMLQLFAKFYGVEHFPTWSEAKDLLGTGSVVASSNPKYGLINVDVFRARYSSQAEAFLAECSLRGEEEGYAGAYCHVAESFLTEPRWLIDGRQAVWLLQGFKQVLTAGVQRYPGIRVVDFNKYQHFEEIFGTGAVEIGGIKVRNSNRQPGSKLTGGDAGLRVVYQFAGDSNAYPGNDYWLRNFAGSGDPAAAAAAAFSLIPFLQNPEIHPEGFDVGRALIVPDPPSSSLKDSGSIVAASRRLELSRDGTAPTYPLCQHGRMIAKGSRRRCSRCPRCHSANNCGEDNCLGCCTFDASYMACSFNHTGCMVTWTAVDGTTSTLATSAQAPSDLSLRARGSLNFNSAGVCKPTAACTRRGHMQRVNKAGREIYYCGGEYDWFWRGYSSWEPGTFKVFNKFVAGRVVLDIGGWIGPTAVWNAYSAEAVVVVEPTSKAFGALCSNLGANSEIAKKVVAIQAAVDSRDRTVRITNRGDSMDRFLEATIDVRAITIETLLVEQPILERTSFVKIDTEGYERIIVPALTKFFLRKKPIAYVSLHPMFISHEQVQEVVDHLKATFPYLYEQDMRTPFNTKRRSYTGGDHGGTDVVCTWQPL